MCRIPSIIDRIPDADILPITQYLHAARTAGIAKLSYNELLMCLLMAQLGA